LPAKDLTIDLGPRRNRLDELVWVLTSCRAGLAANASHAAGRPHRSVDDDEALRITAEALVRVSRGARVAA
jgi:hypothetical protein